MARTPRKRPRKGSDKDLALPASWQPGQREQAEEAQEAFALDVMPGPAAGVPTLLLWAARYMTEDVVGILADNTVLAKKNDLRAFMAFYGQANGHLSAESWMKRDTQAFMRHLEQLGRAPTTINRALRTLKRFCRWVQQQPGTPFAATGLPTASIAELVVDEPDANRLSRQEILKLFKAADRRVLTETRKNSRPRRNRAILAVLYYTGVRVNELVHLQLDQWDGKRFHNVKRKGRTRTKLLYVAPEGRELLEDYLDNERHRDQADSPWLFLPTTGAGPLTTRMVHKLLVQLAEEATKHGGSIHIHPHRLRHTFGYAMRQQTKSDTETAMHLGHKTIQHVGRYARSTQEEREAALDKLSVGVE